MVKLTIFFPFTLLLITVPGLSLREWFHPHTEVMYCAIGTPLSAPELGGFGGGNFSVGLANQGLTFPWWSDQQWAWGQDLARESGPNRVNSGIFASVIRKYVDLSCELWRTWRREKAPAWEWELAEEHRERGEKWACCKIGITVGLTYGMLWKLNEFVT